MARYILRVCTTWPDHVCARLEMTQGKSSSSAQQRWDWNEDTQMKMDGWIWLNHEDMQGLFKIWIIRQLRYIGKEERNGKRLINTTADWNQHTPPLPLQNPHTTQMHGWFPLFVMSLEQSGKITSSLPWDFQVSSLLLFPSSRPGYHRKQAPRQRIVAGCWRLPCSQPVLLSGSSWFLQWTFLARTLPFHLGGPPCNVESFRRRLWPLSGRGWRMTLSRNDRAGRGRQSLFSLCMMIGLVKD